VAGQRGTEPRDVVIGVEVEADDLVAVNRSLRRLENGKELRKKLRDDIKAAAKPVVPAIRAKVKGLPSKGQGDDRERPGLRKSIAKATRLQVQMSGRYAGVTIRVDPKKMPAGMHNLPAYLEGAPPFQRWRVPNWGRNDRHTQHPHPYFYAIATHAEPHIKRAVADAVDSIRRQIDDE
jgi:hypothetical protein